jgi:hypothetical protein
MSVQWSPEWLSETAVTNVLKAGTGLQNFYISDTLQKRKWPCLIVTCNTSEQDNTIGRGLNSQGGYQSGVFKQTLEIALEVKADLLVQPSQTAQVTPEMAQLWMQVYQSLFQTTILPNLLTESVVQPYQCFSATIGQIEQSVDDEKRVWRKSMMLNLRVMAALGNPPA